jgi:nucleoside diphosphate-linked moiety X motif protein 19
MASSSSSTINKKSKKQGVPVPVRLASTILVLGKCNNQNSNNNNSNEAFKSQCNYKVLMIKRSKGMKFMANLFAFPGGQHDQADTTNEWYHVVQQRMALSKSRIRSEINENLSHRIAALRELFEETALLCASPVTSQSSHQQSSLYSTHTILDNNPSIHDSVTSTVHNDATQFYNELYTKRQLLPDVHKMIPWCRWITPGQESRRFDTYFYVIALPHVLDDDTVKPELNEISEAKFLYPDEALALAEKSQISLPPPTAHTLWSLLQQPDLDTLLKNNTHRDIQPIMPTLLLSKSTGTIISCLPGDVLYRRPTGINAKYGVDLTASAYNRIYRLPNGNAWRVVVGDTLPSDVPELGSDIQQLDTLFAKSKL